MYQSSEADYIRVARNTLASDPFLTANFGRSIESLISGPDPLHQELVQWLATNAHVVQGLSQHLQSVQHLTGARGFFRAFNSALEHSRSAPENYRSSWSELRAASWAMTQRLPFSRLRPDSVEFASPGQELYDLVYVKDGVRRLVSVKNAEEFDPSFSLLTVAMHYRETFDPNFRRMIDVQVRILTSEQSRDRRRTAIKQAVDHFIDELDTELQNTGARTIRRHIHHTNCDFYVRYGELLPGHHLFLGMFGSELATLPVPLSYAKMIAELGHDLVPYTRHLQAEFMRFYAHSWTDVHNQHLVFISRPGGALVLYQTEFNTAIRNINRAFGIKPYYMDTTFNADVLL